MGRKARAPYHMERAPRFGAEGAGTLSYGGGTTLWGGGRGGNLLFGTCRRLLPPDAGTGAHVLTGFPGDPRPCRPGPRFHGELPTRGLRIPEGLPGHGSPEVRVPGLPGAPGAVGLPRPVRIGCPQNSRSSRGSPGSRASETGKLREPRKRRPRGKATSAHEISLRRPGRCPAVSAGTCGTCAAPGPAGQGMPADRLRLAGIGAPRFPPEPGSKA